MPPGSPYLSYVHTAAGLRRPSAPFSMTHETVMIGTSSSASTGSMSGPPAPVVVRHMQVC
jgi:hypothetical protein